MTSAAGVLLLELSELVESTLHKSQGPHRSSGVTVVTEHDIALLLGQL